MAGENNFKCSNASNLHRFLYEKSFEKEESSRRIREALLEAAIHAKAQSKISRDMFYKKITIGEPEPHKAQVGRFLLDQMLEEKRVAAAALKVLNQFDEAMRIQKKLLDNLLKS
jgi:hypothetical protein